MELTVQDTPRQASGVRSVVVCCAAAISLGVLTSAAHAAPRTMMAAANAKTTAAEASAVAPPLEGRPVPRGKGRYYVDFRARTAASYGHAFVWYGRTDDPMVEVAGLHPASDSPVPYVIGHVVPVPAETGASYGDLDEQYVTAHYRVYLSEPDAKKTFAYIKHLQQISLLWHGPTYNCMTFIGEIATYIGLKAPATGLMYPEDWVKKLEEMNGGRKIGHVVAEN